MRVCSKENRHNWPKRDGSTFNIFKERIVTQRLTLAVGKQSLVAVGVALYPPNESASLESQRCGKNSGSRSIVP